MNKLDWWPDWEGQTVVIVASGPSAKDVPLHLAKGNTRFIAINSSWRLCEWAEILYACDAAWWNYYRGCPEFPGLKLTVDWKAAEKYPGVRFVECRRPDDRIYLKPINTIGWGSNSGFQALNLAVQFGCKKIILVGFDMTTKHGTHWHGRHPNGMNNPVEGKTDRWRRSVDNAWHVLHPLGIRIINCSPVSTLTKYPKMSFEQALCA